METQRNNKTRVLRNCFLPFFRHFLAVFLPRKKTKKCIDKCPLLTTDNTKFTTGNIVGVYRADMIKNVYTFTRLDNHKIPRHAQNLKQLNIQLYFNIILFVNIVLNGEQDCKIRIHFKKRLTPPLSLHQKSRSPIRLRL